MSEQWLEDVVFSKPATLGGLEYIRVSWPGYEQLRGPNAQPYRLVKATGSGWAVEKREPMKTDQVMERWEVQEDETGAQLRSLPLKTAKAVCARLMKGMARPTKTVTEQTEGFALAEARQKAYDAKLRELSAANAKDHQLSGTEMRRLAKAYAMNVGAPGGPEPAEAAAIDVVSGTPPKYVTGNCPVCGGEFKLYPRGTLLAHKTPGVSDSGPRAWCTGSQQLPVPEPIDFVKRATERGLDNDVGHPVDQDEGLQAAKPKSGWRWFCGGAECPDRDTTISPVPSDHLCPTCHLALRRQKQDPVDVLFHKPDRRGRPKPERTTVTELPGGTIVATGPDALQAAASAKLEQLERKQEAPYPAVAGAFWQPCPDCGRRMQGDGRPRCGKCAVKFAREQRQGRAS